MKLLLSVSTCLIFLFVSYTSSYALTLYNVPTNPPGSDIYTSIKISNVKVIGVSTTSVAITWTTDVPGDSMVSYNEILDFIGAVKKDSVRVTSHTMKITGLKPNTIYHYVVYSTNSYGNKASSHEYSFSTKPEVVDQAPANSRPEVEYSEDCDGENEWLYIEITDVVVQPRVDGAVFTWTTKGCGPSRSLELYPASGFVYVNEGDTFPNDYRNAEKNFGYAQLRGPQHTVTAKSTYFKPNTSYHFRIYSKDAFEREDLSLLGEFTTLDVDQAPDNNNTPVPSQQTPTNGGTTSNNTNSNTPGSNPEIQAEDDNSGYPTEEEIKEITKKTPVSNNQFMNIIKFLDSKPLFGVLTVVFVLLMFFFVVLVAVLVIILLFRRRKKKIVEPVIEPNQPQPPQPKIPDEKE